MGSYTVGRAMRCSSNQLITWVNTVLQLDGRDSRSEGVSSLKETATGCFYAQILDALLPGKVRMSCVVWGKHGSVLEHEVINNFKVIAVALHGAGVEHRIDYDGMIKGHLAAVLEFTQWLNKFASDPYFVDRIRDYDAAQRRAFCKQSIRGHTAGKTSGRGRSESISSTSSSRRRRRRSTGDPRATLGVVKEGGGAETGTVISDCNSRCRTAFAEEEAVLYTTAGHGVPYRRTLRARKIPSPGSGGGEGGGSGDARKTRRLTVPLRARRPRNEGVCRGEDLRCAWPGNLLSSRPEIGQLRSGQPRLPARGLPRTGTKGGCKETNVVAVRNRRGKPNNKPSPSPPPPLESVVWDRELVVHHPRVPPGCELRVEVTPGGAVGARRLESLFREMAKNDDNDDSNGQPVVVLGSMRGIRKGGSSVLKFFLAASGDTTCRGGDGDGGGGGGGGGGRCHRDHDSWPSLDGETCARKLPAQSLRGGKEGGHGHGHGVEERARLARVWGNNTEAGGNKKSRGKTLAIAETPDCHNEVGVGKIIPSKKSSGGEGRKGRRTSEGSTGYSAKGTSFLTAVEAAQGKMRPSPPLLPRRRRRFGADGTGSSLLSARTRRLNRRQSPLPSPHNLVGGPR